MSDPDVKKIVVADDADVSAICDEIGKHYTREVVGYRPTTFYAQIEVVRENGEQVIYGAPLFDGDV